MGKRLVLLLVGVLVIGLTMTSVALADAATWHTPQNIYDDYTGADGSQAGELDGDGAPYTVEELKAYSEDATFGMYALPEVKEPLDQVVTDLLTRDEFPFTGFQLMIAGIVAVVLVGGGIGLRRLSRPQKS